MCRALFIQNEKVDTIRRILSGENQQRREAGTEQSTNQYDESCVYEYSTSTAVQYTEYHSDPYHTLVLIHRYIPRAHNIRAVYKKKGLGGGGLSLAIGGGNAREKGRCI